MLDNIATMLSTGAVGGAVVAVVNYFLTRRLQRRVETLKSELLKDQARFTWLHESQAKAVVRLYAGLSMLRRDLKAFIDLSSKRAYVDEKALEAEGSASEWAQLDDKLEDQERVAPDRLEKRIEQIYVTLSEAAVFLTPELEKKLWTVWEELATRTFEETAKQSSHERLELPSLPADWVEHFNEEKATKLDKAVQPLLHDIKNQCRELLGV